MLPNANHSLYKIIDRHKECNRMSKRERERMDELNLRDEKNQPTDFSLEFFILINSYVLNLSK